MNLNHLIALLYSCKIFVSIPIRDLMNLNRYYLPPKSLKLSVSIPIRDLMNLNPTQRLQMQLANQFQSLLGI